MRIAWKNRTAKLQEASIRLSKNTYICSIVLNNETLHELTGTAALGIRMNQRFTAKILPRLNAVLTICRSCTFYQLQRHLVQKYPTHPFPSPDPHGITVFPPPTPPATAPATSRYPSASDISSYCLGIVVLRIETLDSGASHGRHFGFNGAYSVFSQ